MIYIFLKSKNIIFRINYNTFENNVYTVVLGTAINDFLNDKKKIIFILFY